MVEGQRDASTKSNPLLKTVAAAAYSVCKTASRYCHAAIGGGPGD
jgi:hypothetical protein